MLLPENIYHVLRAQLTLPSDTAHQNCPFAGTAFSFSLSSSSSGLCLYMWGKHQDYYSLQVIELFRWAGVSGCLSKSYWSTECLSAVVLVVLFFTCCLAIAEAVYSRAVVSWCMLYLTVVRGHSGGKEQWSLAGIASSEVLRSLSKACMSLKQIASFLEESVWRGRRKGRYIPTWSVGKSTEKTPEKGGI